MINEVEDAINSVHNTESNNSNNEYLLESPKAIELLLQSKSKIDNSSRNSNSSRE